MGLLSGLTALARLSIRCVHTGADGEGVAGRGLDGVPRWFERLVGNDTEDVGKDGLERGLDV